MAVVGDLNAVDCLMWLAFDDCSRAVGRAKYLIANACDGNAGNGEMGCGDTGDSSAVSCWVIQADDIRHVRPQEAMVPHHIRPASTRLPPDTLDVRP